MIERGHSMSMKTWAEKEVEIACGLEREHSGIEEPNWDYGSACYQSALKAFTSLLDDGHSGVSIIFTREALLRLIDHLPLTPIVDTEDCWSLAYNTGDGVQKYSCNRFGSLYKYVYPDGKVKYRDINRTICVDINSETKAPYYSNWVAEIIDEMFPVTMPYYPSKKQYKVCCDTFLFRKNGGDFDTRAILTVTTPEGEIVDINRYFAEKNSSGFEEIDYLEYVRRKKYRSVKFI